MKSRGVFCGAVLCGALFLPAVAEAHAAANVLRLQSPDRRVQISFSLQGGHLAYQLSRDGHPLLKKSPLGIRNSDDAVLADAHFGKTRRYRIADSYPSYGVHSVAREDGTGMEVAVLARDGDVAYTLETRAYNNGVAFRMTLPGTAPRTPLETTEFNLIDGSAVWSLDPAAAHYEGVYARSKAEEIPPGRFMAPPVVIELPSDSSYLAITEGRLKNYPGMMLQSNGKGTFSARPGNEVPADNALRYFQGEAIAKTLALPAAIAGSITTPWRVVMIGATLNELVNNDIVSDVSDAPDAGAFPEGARTPWIKPGRAVWNFLDGGARTLEGAREFSRMAGDLGFEYQVVEGQWNRWSETDLKGLVDYSRARGVGIWLWKNRRDLATAESRKAWFDLCNRTGVVGVKIDFFDSEAKEVVDLYQSILVETAEHHLMVDFHGANKPTGEQRTWPNELTREAVEGMEYCCIEGIADAPRARHAVTVPFTRFLAGPADYTPVLLDKGRNGTTWANQIASAVILTSPLLTYAANPETLLSNPAVSIIRDIPSTWDETVVLQPSKIGSLAIFARRSGKTWFLACMNGDEPLALDISLSFLGSGSWKAQSVTDAKDNPAAVRVEAGTFQPDRAIHLALASGGGSVAEFKPE